MSKDLSIRMQSQFDQMAQSHPAKANLEFWFARDLQEQLGYVRWVNFLTAIQRAIASCKTTGYENGPPWPISFVGKQQRPCPDRFKPVYSPAPTAGEMDLKGGTILILPVSCSGD